MSEGLWFAATLMTVLAFAFVARPLFVSNRRKTLVALALTLPLISAGLYLLLGSPQTESAASSPIHTSQAPATMGTAPGKVDSVASMVDGLAERLRESPDDGKGWLLLAKSYQHLDRMDEAANAYARAAALGEYDEELAGLDESLQKAPQSKARIHGRLSLSDRAVKLVEPSDTVFIFARAATNAGPPAAVLRRSARDLPFTFVLDDSQSMVAGLQLSSFETVVVTARVSRSGTASDTLSDLEITSGPVNVAHDAPVELTIE